MEQIARPADKSGVSPFWQVDESPATKAWSAQPVTTAAEAGGAGRTAAPLLTEMEQLFGEETEPDAAFFVDSWTAGVTAASENFLRRQERKSRDQEMPRWNMPWSFTPFFVGGAEAADESGWAPRKAPAGRGSMADPPRRGKEKEADGQTAEEQAADAAEIATPVTLESARRMLGVTTASTREQIRAAYRKMANRYHPDRLAYRGAGEQSLAGDRMASINEAYRMLSACSAVTAE